MKNRFASLLIGLSLLVTAGCARNSGFDALDMPVETAKLKDLEATEDEEGDEATENPEFTGDETEPTPAEVEKELAQTSNDTPETEESDSNPVGHGASTPDKKAKASMLSIAKWVIQNEARRVGPACNFFIQRVFKLMGFGRSSWLANGFDRYVKSSFTSYDLETFDYDASGSDQKRLKNYIWSLPEKTPMVFQWKRRSGPGHVAIVHRNGNELVVYHASLNKFNAKAQRITIETLLYRSRVSYVLNVFSDFKK